MNATEESPRSTGLPLVIVGAGGHGRETLDIVRAQHDAGDRRFEFVGFADDADVDAERLHRLGERHLGGHEIVREHEGAYVIGIGTPKVRRRIQASIGEEPLAACLVHPAATIGGDVELSEGVLVAAGSHVTTNVRIGRHTHLNVGSIVSHDSTVGEFVSISQGAMINGDVVIGDDVFIGTGAIVMPGIKVGDGAVVGAGAVVNRDVGVGTTVAGVPARRVHNTGMT